MRAASMMVRGGVWSLFIHSGGMYHAASECQRPVLALEFEVQSK